MLKEILTATNNTTVDTANETVKFEVGKTYYAADFAGEWSEDAPVIVKTLNVIKRTAKTLTAIDENGNQVLKRISLAYAGTKETVVVASVNDITVQTVHIYSDNEYTPAIAAAPTAHFNAWVEAITNTKAAVEENVEYKPQCTWEDPHNYETVGCLTHARNLNTGLKDITDELQNITATVKREWGTFRSTVCIRPQDGSHPSFRNHCEHLTINVGEGNFTIKDKWYGTFFARYDTFAQVEQVITRLKDVFMNAHGIDNPEFTFPTVDELNTPPAPVAETVEDHSPVEEHKLTRRELEAYKNSVMAEIDEYREGLIEYQDDPDVNPTHIDFLKSSIDSKLAEYYDICKQLDELDDEPETPEPKAPSPVETPEPKTVDVKKVSAVVYYTCTADKSNWAKDKYFETTTAAAEWILSFVKTRVFDCTVRDAEIIDRRNGYVRYALTDADITAVNTVNTEPELPTPKPDSPFAIARGLDDVFQKTFHKVDAPYMDVTTQDGAKIATTFGAAYISVDWRAVDGYVFGNHFNDVLARYETPEQVTEVMTALRDAIKAGKTEFTFPTVEELTAPPEPDDAKSTFDRVVKTRRHGIGHVTTKQGRHMWYIYGRLVNKKEITEWLADEGFTVEEYIAAEKVADKYEEEVEFPRRMAIREQAEFLWDKIADDRKASVEPMPPLYPSDDSDDDELIDPPEVKAPADEFTAKLAAFDAEITHAETARDAAKAAYDKADANAQNAIAARQDFLDKTAGVLTEKLHAIPPHRDYIGTATLSGCPVTFMDFDNVYVDATLGGKFKFVTCNNRALAQYDTPAQVETVIGKLKDAVERHKPVFHFPTVEELNASPEPPKTESVKARKSSLSPSARRYINAREEAQERRIRREYLWDLEQRFYPN